MYVRVPKKGRQQVKGHTEAWRSGLLSIHCVREVNLDYECVEQMDGPSGERAKEHTQVGRKGTQTQEGQARDQRAWRLHTW